MIRPDAVAIYIRWSTEDQGDGTTLAVQQEACRHYLLSQGWQVRDDLTFIDDGHSGGSLDRPAMTRLRQTVRKGQVDCVVVFRLDRLSRSVVDTVTLVLQEWADLTHVKSAREPVDTTTAMGRQFFYMLVSYAEWERNVIRERMFGGKLRRAREGRNPGMPPAYGYRKGSAPGAMEPEPQEERAVRTAFDLADRGQSVRAITEHLNQHGFPTRKGGPWGSSMVSKLLRNPLYAGRLVWGRRRANPRHGKAPGEPRLKVTDPHAEVPATAIPALVEPDQFARVQARLERTRRTPPAAAGSPHQLSGILHCARCGRPMQFNAHGPWTYYRCASRGQGAPCGAPSIPAAALEAAVVGELRSRYEAEAIQRAAAIRQSREEAQQRELEADRASVETARARLATQEQRLAQDYRQGQITAQQWQALAASIEADRERLTEVETHLRQRGPAALTLPDPWNGLSPHDHKSLLLCLIARVTAIRLGPQETLATITWHGTAAQAGAR